MWCWSKIRTQLWNGRASPLAHLVKNPPAMRETWVPSQVGKIPWRREQLPTPVFWPGEFHGLYSPSGHKELDVTERLSLSFSHSCFHSMNHETRPFSKIGMTYESEKINSLIIIVFQLWELTTPIWDDIWYVMAHSYLGWFSSYVSLILRGKASALSTSAFVV